MGLVFRYLGQADIAGSVHGEMQRQATRARMFGATLARGRRVRSVGLGRTPAGAALDLAKHPRAIGDGFRAGKGRPNLESQLRIKQLIEYLVFTSLTPEPGARFTVPGTEEWDLSQSLCPLVGFGFDGECFPPPLINERQRPVTDDEEQQWVEDFGDLVTFDTDFSTLNVHVRATRVAWAILCMNIDVVHWCACLVYGSQKAEDVVDKILSGDIKIRFVDRGDRTGNRKCKYDEFPIGDEPGVVGAHTDNNRITVCLGTQVVKDLFEIFHGPWCPASNAAKNRYSAAVGWAAELLHETGHSAGLWHHGDTCNDNKRMANLFVYCMQARWPWLLYSTFDDQRLLGCFVALNPPASFNIDPPGIWNSVGAFEMPSGTRCLVSGNNCQ
jgi:hypothetical protein